VVAGTVGMSYRRLVSWGAVGAVAWSMLYVGIGAAAGASWRQYGDRIGLIGLAVFGAALAILLVVRAARRGPGRPDHRVGPGPSTRSQPEHLHADARQKDRVHASWPRLLRCCAAPVVTLRSDSWKSSPVAPGGSWRRSPPRQPGPGRAALGGRPEGEQRRRAGVARTRGAGSTRLRDCQSGLHLQSQNPARPVLRARRAWSHTHTQ
jgi:hypothetical protein